MRKLCAVFILHFLLAIGAAEEYTDDELDGIVLDSSGRAGQRETPLDAKFDDQPYSFHVEDHERQGRQFMGVSNWLMTSRVPVASPKVNLNQRCKTSDGM